MKQTSVPAVTGSNQGLGPLQKFEKKNDVGRFYHVFFSTFGHQL